MQQSPKLKIGGSNPSIPAINQYKGVSASPLSFGNIAPRVRHSATGVKSKSEPSEQGTIILTSLYLQRGIYYDKQ